MTPEELKRAEELCEKATPGPWLPSVDGKKWVQISHASNLEVALNYKNDAAFVAESRELMPKLIAVVEQIQERLQGQFGYGWGEFTKHFTFDEYMKLEIDSDDPDIPLSDRVQALVEQEQGRWQGRLEEIYGNVEGVHNIDGSACDSGDPLDLTASEVSQVIDALVEQRDDLREDLAIAERALKLLAEDMPGKESTQSWIDSSRKAAAAELAKEQSNATT